ncbi:MAG: hypothetical protein ACI8Z0_002201, partial [Lentimonas sp.]
MEVDPAFNKAKRNAKKRKTGRRIRQFVIFGGGFAGVALVTGIVLFFTLGGRDDGIYIDADDGPGFVQVEENSIPATSLIRTTTPFVDIAGDPMILRFERASGSEVGEPLAGPPTLDAERLGNPAPDRLLLVVEALVV